MRLSVIERQTLDVNGEFPERELRDREGSQPVGRLAGLQDRGWRQRVPFLAFSVCRGWPATRRSKLLELLLNCCYHLWDLFFT